jgi:hypothetical protein
MSRLTGTDAYGLMEAYQAVYAPQELTEEQVWEEVENWVNSLLEEGYDLSDYTWEEMYEEYLEEIYGTNLGGNTKTKPNKLDTAVGNAIKSITSSGADATPRTTGIYGQPTRKPASPTFQNTGGFGRYAPPSTQVKTPAPAAPANRTPGLTPVPITRTPAPATKPAAPAAISPYLTTGLSNICVTGSRTLATSFRLNPGSRGFTMLPKALPKAPPSLPVSFCV